MARIASEKTDAVRVPLDMIFAREHMKSPEGSAKLNLTLDGIHFSEKGSCLAADAMLKAWKMK
jgi:hypothetical protein